MFTLVTGTPGACKTLHTIDTYSKVKDRSIYYGNIDGLSPDLGWIEVAHEHIRDYHKHIPQGAIFILDEAQKYFPVRSPSAPVPSSISHLEMHRHEGQDIVFITQHPSLIDHHARRLVGEHRHFQRNFGMPFSTYYRGNQLIDTTNWHELQKCEKTQYKHNKEVFGLYKSAEVHTHKIRFPKKLLLLIPLFAMIFGGIYAGKSALFDKKDSSSPVQNSSAAVAVPAASAAADKPFSLPSLTTPEQVHKAFTPVVAGMPWTAPYYTELAKPVAMPVVKGCIKSTASGDSRCSCYTQQATVVDMPPEVCSMYVHKRTFNPFQPDHNNQPEQLQVADNQQGYYQRAANKKD
jgi:zona occludens toxin